MKGEILMKLIAEKSIYENEITKYLEHKKRNDLLIKISSLFCFCLWFLFLGCWFIFFVMLIVWFFDDIPHAMSVTFYIICGILFIIGLGMVFVEHIKVEPSWGAKIWLINKTNTKNGYVFDSVEFWIDSDKIFCHLIYVKGDEKKPFFCRLDDFNIRKCSEEEEATLDIDNYTLLI